MMNGIEISETDGHAKRTRKHCWRWLLGCVSSRRLTHTFLVTSLLVICPGIATAQQNPSERRAAEALAETPVNIEIAAAETMSLPWLELVVRGGWLMLPIGMMSVLVVALGFERAISLRRGRIAPRALARRLSEMAESDGFDARMTIDACRRCPSALGRVVQAMVIRSGRPPSEIEHAMRDACQREADDMYGPVRTINLATSITPLLGLLGTVLGMIQAFFATANLVAGANRGQALAEGIYVALVTTFAGLSVAIPAAVLAHFFESRILRQLRDVEQIATDLLPHIASAQAYDGCDPPRLTMTGPREAMPQSSSRSRAS